MHIIRGIAVAFSTYSKIPMPQFVWKEEDMRYSMCFFPWIGAVIGAILWGMVSVVCVIGNQYACIYSDISCAPAYYHRGLPCGWVYGYHGCIAFVSAQRAKTGNFKGFPHWSFFCDQAGGIRVDLCGGSFPDCGLPCAGSVLLWIFPVPLPEWSERGLLPFRKNGWDALSFASTAHERGVKGALYAQTLLCVLFMLWLSLLAGILAVAAAFAVFGYYRWRSYREFGGITGDTAGYFLTLCEGAMAVAAAVSVLI